MLSPIVLTDEQQAAYNTIGVTKTLFLSGAAGCGKSVIITERMKNDTTGKFILCATTNQACRILSEKLNTGKQVPTLQSVLNMKPIYDGSTKNEDKLIDFYFQVPPKNFTSLVGMHLIIDEASMICKNTQHYLLELIELEHLESVTFVGDKYQLPCVKKEPFEYHRIDKVIELQYVKRANGELLDYYNQIRKDVINDEELSMFEHARYFDTTEEFSAYIKNIEGSKCVISWTNQAADTFSKLIDTSEIYEGKEYTALAYCSFKRLMEDDYEHNTKNDSVSFTTNSNIQILKIFKDYDAMKRAAAREMYEYKLPKKPVNIELEIIKYVKVLSEDRDEIYVGIWDAPAKEKETLYLNNMTRKYRKFLNSIKHKVPTTIWNRYAKEDGYPKSLYNISKHVKFSRDIIVYELSYWNDFHAIMEAVPVRSIYSTTAHRVQGTTVDVAGINWADISKGADKKLQYVALTRAAKELVFYIGDENEAVQ
ncbi:AAA family ATPase [Sulfurimonas sp. NW9]|uniref:AAA family ATPase n=1 Tax=Sulfurimonas sp. NW9 TaxID=2922728 RepID=UPI003DA8B8FA